MSLLETPRMQMLSNYLDQAAFRQSVIASNVANVDTPGYRALDVNFRSHLEAAGGLENVHLKTREVPGLLQRPDGNNVSLERESLLMAQTQLQFRTGVELLRAEFRRLQSAIQEGSR
jgi:flagellar basal-body rod protein FlgB